MTELPIAPINRILKKADPTMKFSKECSKELRKMTAKRCNKKWKENNREKVKEYQKKWIKNNPEKRKEIERKWWDKYYSNREQNIDDIFNAYYEYLDDCGVE